MSLHIYKDASNLARGLAAWIAGDINLKLKEKPRYSLVLSGGSTPKKLYELLASKYADKVSWNRVDFFWGDERHVPYEDERNNGRMAYEALLQPLGIADDHIYMMRTDVAPEISAKNYEEILREYFGESTISFDFTLLGMGTDGHTLSVFPDSPLLEDTTTWVRSVLNEKENLQRITLMPSLVNRSVNMAFMVSGEDKADMLHKVMRGAHEPKKYPSQLIKKKMGELQWFVDEGAASRLMAQ